jgi:broad specificity phosphatase PhoE
MGFTGGAVIRWALFCCVVTIAAAIDGADPIYAPQRDNRTTTAKFKKIYLIRHGQAQHNVDVCSKYPDAQLTPHGVEQARRIRCSVGKDPEPELILYSPLRRAVQTLAESYGHLCKGQGQGQGQGQASGVRCLAVADLQEDWNGEAGFDCDTGSAPALLGQIFPQYDFSTLSADWMKADSHLPQKQKINERHTRVRAWIAARAESTIMIVAHHGTIKGLLGMKEGIGNGDVLEFSFDVDRRVFVKDDSPFIHHKNIISCNSPTVGEF